MTLSFFTSKDSHKPNPDGGADNPNAAVQMPHVYVVPPEEDETPAWCFFDAANPTLSQIVERSETPDISVLSFPSADTDTPIFRRNPPGSIDSVIMPRRSIEALSVVDALMSDELEGDNDTDSDSEYERHMELDENPHAIRESARRGHARTLRDAADDSDVIEVVKVRRRRTNPDEAEERQNLPPSWEHTRSNTLKSRASKAFKSFRGSFRYSKPHAQDIFSTSTSSSRLISQDEHESIEQQQPESLPRPRTPTVSRKGSRILSQLFRAPSLRSRSSMSSFDEPIPASPTLLISQSSSSMRGNFVATSSSSHDPPRRTSIYEASAQDQARLQAASPTPTNATKSSTRRFSMLNLNKIFSFASSNPRPAVSVDSPVTYEESDRATPTLRSISTTSGPQTPTSTEGAIPTVQLVRRDETADLPVFDSLNSMFDANVGLNLGLGLGLSLDSNPTLGSSQQSMPRKSSSSWASITPKRFSKANPFLHSSRTQEPDDDGDESLEMRLDSLHFESLSFDADRFIAD